MSALLGVSLLAGSLPPVKVAPKAAVAQTQAEQSTEDSGAYLFVHFIDEEQSADKEQVYFSVSKNGTSWKTLNDVKPVLDAKSLGGTGGIRDPHIIRSPEGDKFYMIATDLSIYNLRDMGNAKWGYSQSNGSQSIVIWESEDLVNWSEPRLVKVGRDNAGCVWAPESIWDKEKNAYMVFWASRTNGPEGDWKHRIYRSYTTDFKEFSEPEVYIESDDSRIDTTFYEHEGVYYRFTKNEGGSAKYVYMERGTSLSGDFEIVSTYTLDGQTYDAAGHLPFEGPTVYKLNGQDRWCMLLDSFNYRPFETDDISKGRFVSAKAFNFGGVLFRHGTVLPISRAEYDALIDEYAGGEDPIEDDVTTGELVYSLDFEENLNVAQGSTVTTAATGTGNLTYVDGVNGGKAIKLSSGNYVQIPGVALAGAKAATITFAAKVDSNRSWLFYAAPNNNTQTYQKEHYIGSGWLLDGYRGIKVQRFNNNGSRPTQAAGAIPGEGEWVHVAMVLHVDSVDLYINGELVSSDGSSHKLVDILGSDPVIYLGRANWEGGQYASAEMDCLKIYNYALGEEAIAQLNEADMGDDKYTPPPPPEPVKPELIYALDFEDNLELTKGEAEAIGHGISYEEGYNGGKAVRISGTGNFIEIPNAPIAGLEEITVSFAVNVTTTRSWMFYAAPNSDAQEESTVSYLGVYQNNGDYMDFERFNHARSWHYWYGTDINKWVHVTIVYERTQTSVYFDGVLQATTVHDNNVSLLEILGKTPVIQLGKANWNSGEYSDMLMDCFKIHNYALTAAEVTALYNSLQNA